MAKLDKLIEGLQKEKGNPKWAELKHDRGYYLRILPLIILLILAVAMALIGEGLPAMVCVFLGLISTALPIKYAAARLK